MVKRGGKLRREAPLPQEMQGRWVIVDDEPSELIAARERSTTIRRSRSWTVR
jgi:hypothetical protein